MDGVVADARADDAGRADSGGTADEEGEKSGESGADERTSKLEERRSDRERGGEGGEVFSRDHFIQSPNGMERVSRNIVGFCGVFHIFRASMSGASKVIFHM